MKRLYTLTAAAALLALTPQAASAEFQQMLSGGITAPAATPAALAGRNTGYTRTNPAAFAATARAAASRRSLACRRRTDRKV